MQNASEPDPWSLQLEPRGDLSPVASLIAVYGFLGVLPLCVLVLAVVKFVGLHRRARLADAELEKSGPLAPGLGAVHGRVEHAPGKDVAVRVEIRQRGSEKESKGNWSHTWQETGRTISVQPFYVVRDDGSKLRVEPTEDVSIVDDPHQLLVHSRTDRTRVVEISAGEAVYALGELCLARDPDEPQGYRGTDRTLVLRRPANGKLLVSSLPLGEPYRRRARAWVLLALAVAGSVIAFAIAALGFHARVLFGTRELAVVTRVEKVTGKGARCDVQAEAGGALQVLGDVHVTWCDGGSALDLAAGDSVPIVRVPGSTWFAQIGPRPTAGSWLPQLGLMLALTILVGWTKRPRPWYERSLVESGAGRLGATTDG